MRIKGARGTVIASSGTATPTGWKHQPAAMSATARCLEATEGPGSGSSRCLFPGKEHRTSVTAAEFKRWLKQFDADGDGRISRRELREAIRRRGAWFASVKAWCAVRRADRDRNGFVDDCEMESLVEFAGDELGFLISKEPTTPDGRNHCRW